MRTKTLHHHTTTTNPNTFEHSSRADTRNGHYRFTRHLLCCPGRNSNQRRVGSVLVIRSYAFAQTSALSPLRHRGFASSSLHSILDDIERPPPPLTSSSPFDCDRRLQNALEHCYCYCFHVCVYMGSLLLSLRRYGLRQTARNLGTIEHTRTAFVHTNSSALCQNRFDVR